MFSQWQRASGMRAREYDQIRGLTDQAIESWQLEDALNALKQNEIKISRIQHNHSRETEQLYTTLAALEHTAKQRQGEVQTLQATLLECQEQAQQQLATANLKINKLQATRVKESRQQASENNRLRGSLQSSTRIIELQAVTLAELDHLCDRREAELCDAQQTMLVTQSELNQTKHQAAEQAASLREKLDRQQRQIEAQHRELAELQARHDEQDADLVAALRLCDETEIKLKHATQQHSREAARLQHTISNLTGTARQQETRARQQESRASELAKERDELQKELSIRLADLSKQSEQKLAAATQRYESQFVTLQTKLNSVESLADDRASQVQQLSSKMMQLQQQYSQEISTARRSVSELEQERDDLKEELSVRLTELSKQSEQELAAATQQYENQFGSMQSKLASLESLADDRASQVQQLSSKMVQLEQEYTEEIAGVQKSAEELVGEVEKSAADAVEKAKQLAAAELEQARKSASDALQQAQQEHEAEVKRLQSVMNSVENAFEASLAEKRKIQEKAVVLEQKCESLQHSTSQQDARAEQIKRLEESVRAGQERIKNEKVKQANRLRRQHEKLQAAFATTSSDRARFQQEARRLAGRLSQLLAQYGRERKHLNQRISRLQAELEQFRSSKLAA
jgi:chromosome segregation ATPase